MPTTETVLFPPPARSTIVAQDGQIEKTFQRWLFSLQMLSPLRIGNTTTGPYSEALPAAGLNSTTGQSNQNQEIIYVKGSADGNAFTVTGGQGGPVVLAAQYDFARFKSDGTVWWRVG